MLRSSPRAILKRGMRPRDTSHSSEDSESDSPSSSAKMALSVSPMAPTSLQPTGTTLPSTPMRRITQSLSFSRRNSGFTLQGPSSVQAELAPQRTPSPTSSSLETVVYHSHVDLEFCETASLLVPDIRAAMAEADWLNFESRFEPGVDYTMESACRSLAEALHIVEEDSSAQAWVYKMPNPLRQLLWSFLLGLGGRFHASADTGFRVDAVAAAAAEAEHGGPREGDGADELDGELPAGAAHVLDVTSSAVKAKELVSRVVALKGDCALSRKVRFLGAFAELDVLVDVKERREAARRIVGLFLEPGGRWDVGVRVTLTPGLFNELRACRLRVAIELADSPMVTNLALEATTPRMRPARPNNSRLVTSPLGGGGGGGGMAELSLAE